MKSLERTNCEMNPSPGSNEDPVVLQPSNPSITWLEWHKSPDMLRDCQNSDVNLMQTNDIHERIEIHWESDERTSNFIKPVHGSLPISWLTLWKRTSVKRVIDDGSGCVLSAFHGILQPPFWSEFHRVIDNLQGPSARWTNQTIRRTLTSQGEIFWDGPV